MSTSTADQDVQSYPRMIIRLEGLPSQCILEQIYGPQAFEYVLPLPEIVFNGALLRRPLTRPFSRTSTAPPIDAIQNPPKNDSEWRDVAISLHRWLEEWNAERETDEWRWAVNTFWIAYTSCNPLFPMGSQDSAIEWKPRLVPMACEHIAQRLQGLDLVHYCENQSWIVWKDWLELRQLWCKNGVRTRDFEARIGRYL